MIHPHSLPHPSAAPTVPDHPALPPMQPRLRLAGYELLERVGAGGMAEVWMARRAVIPGCLKTCALKIIHGRIAAQPRYRRLFLQEARLALKLRHANLVSVFDVGEVEGRLYMALEWVDGVNLRDFAEHVRARQGGLSVPMVCHVVNELLQGLRHAHGLRVGGQPLDVVHRDVAPHNVLVSTEGEVKLADFGIARVVGELSSGLHVKGRARYMAPEQLYGDATQASDLFALGAIVHELLDGRRFRDGLERCSDWHRVVAEAELPPLHRDDVPPALEALRVGLLQPDPARRIACADEALAWLLRCPPWPPGATTLRELYQSCVGEARRTGFTDHELVRASPPDPCWSLGVVPSLRAPGPSGPRSIAGPSPFTPPPSEPVPTRVPAPPSRPERTATLERRVQAPSWTPTPSGSPSPSLGTEPLRPIAPEAVILRRRAAPRPYRPRPGSSAGLRWLGRGLWLLAGVLAVVAAGLALAPSPTRSSACIEEAPGPQSGEDRHTKS